jgi:hypothetical protein
MTKKEAIQILAILKAAYPSSYNNMTKEEASGTVGVWCMQFEDMPGDIVLMAINKLISTSKFPPTVAEVKDKLKSMHWEAHELLTWRNTDFSPVEISDSQAKQYERIAELTRQYKYGTTYEPKLYQMMSSDRRLLE